MKIVEDGVLEEAACLVREGGEVTDQHRDRRGRQVEGAPAFGPAPDLVEVLIEEPGD